MRVGKHLKVVAILRDCDQLRNLLQLGRRSIVARPVVLEFILVFMELLIHIENGHVLLDALDQLVLAPQLLQVFLGDQSPVSALALAVSQMEVAIIMLVELLLNIFYGLQLVLLVH